MEPQYVVAIVFAALFVGFVLGAACSTSNHLESQTTIDGMPLPGYSEGQGEEPDMVVVEWLENKDKKGGADAAYIWIRNVKHPHQLGLVDLALTEEDWARTNDRAERNQEDLPEPPQG